VLLRRPRLVKSTVHETGSKTKRLGPMMFIPMMLWANRLSRSWQPTVVFPSDTGVLSRLLLSALVAGSHSVLDMSSPVFPR
jgi:hypothetical protein